MHILRMVYSLSIRTAVPNHEFFTVVLYTDQDTFYKISLCSGNVKEVSRKTPGKCLEAERGSRPCSYALFLFGVRFGI